jgi:hypothetical protein
MYECFYGYTSLNIVDNAEESELELVTPKVHIPDNPVTEDFLEIGKRSFHGIAHTTLFAVGFLLIVAQWTASSALVQHPAIYPIFSALALHLVFGICFVGKDRALITTKQFIKFLAIMYTGGSKRRFRITLEP